MFEQTDGLAESAEPRPAPRKRLRQLAAEVSAAKPPPDDAEGTGPDGRAGRLVERWLPAGGPLSGGPGRRRVAMAAAAAGAAAVLVTVTLLLAQRPEPERPPPLPAAREPAAAGHATPGTVSATSATSEPLVVSVVGKVAEPGLVTVAPGARVADAVDAAGGARPGTDLATINLARRLTDGEQLYVGVPVPPRMRTAVAGPGAAAAAEGAAEPAVNLNSAGQDELEELPGVGEVTARRIRDWRSENGRFTAVEQLREVDGIGEKRFEQLRDLVAIR